MCKEREAKQFYDEHYAKKESSIITKPWYLFLQGLMVEVEGKKILEVGCGDGGFSLWMSRKNEVFGIDISKVGLERATDRANNKANFCLADAQQLPFRDRVFDIIIAAEVLEHIPQPDYALGEINRVLKSGGSLYLTVPNIFSLYVGMKWLIGYPLYKILKRNPPLFFFQPIDHKFQYLTLKQLFKDANFNVNNVWGDSYLLPFARQLFGQSSRLIKQLEKMEKPLSGNRLFKYLGRALIVIASKRD